MCVSRGSLAMPRYIYVEIYLTREFERCYTDVYIGMRSLHRFPMSEVEYKAH